MELTSLKVYTTSHPFRQTPLATEQNFGSSNFIGSLRGQSEMTLNRISSDPHNRVNSLDLILMRLQLMENHFKACNF